MPPGLSLDGQRQAFDSVAQRGPASLTALTALTAVTVVVPAGLSHVESVLGGTPWTVLQAPVWTAQVSGLLPPAGFAETLLRFGFLHPGALAGLCRAWRALIDGVAPQMIVCDYAPTALLATRGLALTRVVFGDSFSIPPATEPVPVYRWWRPETPARVADAERHALAGANAVLARRGEPPLQRLADLLAADASIMTTFEEFDQYPVRTGGSYWGAMPALDQGVAPDWPDMGTKRVFAYVKPRSRDFDKLLGALAALGEAAVVVHAPGISTALQRKHLAANIRFSTEPVRMAEACRDADLGICHSGAGTVQALVVAG